MSNLYLIIMIITSLSTAVLGWATFIEKKKNNKQKVEHEQDITTLEHDHEMRIQKLKGEHEKSIEKMKSEHEKYVMEIKHEQDMEKTKYISEINTNSPEGLNVILRAMKSLGINPDDVSNNPEKINKQISNINSINFARNK